MVNIFLFVMVGLFVVGWGCVATILIRWMMYEKHIPNSRKVVATFFPFLILLPSFHVQESRALVKILLLISIISFCVSVSMYLHLSNN